MTLFRGTARLLVTTVLAVPLAVSGSTAEADPRPNIVMILADDLDERATPYWESMPKTKALLQDSGLTFTDSFATTPICCAARASILTGQYGHNTQVLTNEGDQGGFAAFVANNGDNESRTFVKHLHDSGYRTGMAGKYLNGLEDHPHHIPPGWDDWNAGVTKSLYTGYNYTLNENGTLVEYGSGPGDYQVDVIADKSVKFIEESAATDRPFFWYAASTAPHSPMSAPPRYAGTRFGAAPHPKNFQEQDVSDKPTWLRQSAKARSATVALTNDWDHHNRMGSLLALDDMVADIVRTLKETGEYDNTYLVFASDNGYNMGAHRLFQKMAPYEESIRVPLVIAGPGVRHGTSRAMVTSIDYAPTFLELAGLPVPADMDGASMTPLFGGGIPQGWRTDFFGQYGGSGLDGRDGIFQEYTTGDRKELYVIDLPSWSSLRTERYTYTRWYDLERAAGEREYELYDLTTDPYQLDNLLATESGRQKYAEVVARLDRRLNELSGCKGIACRKA
ncbi:sulfatase family protein [Nonomuraea dietziae]|uniref:Arylsulfatase A-like enzyme n=1 Tax=Nonomuraea dietziae TaxID=65515 RepID=A0A7W5Y4S4_9ACTN|nr:sulfatase [Nonomuraea dietziae]MBB3724158.1 arylsulfatase A-like enzyme [Nonomuraea dietziae]